LVSQDPHPRTQVTEAIFDGGVLRPVGRLDLHVHQRVRVIVQSLEGPSAEGRAAALERLRVGIAGMNFRSTNGYPSRDDLHERA
jgi:predicted DNA-binding antitoxin AbrB/MazE fold protein